MTKPLPRTRDELLRSLGETDLPKETVQHLANQARPALLLRTVPAEARSHALGASRLGGSPDLPAGTAWPERPPYPDAAKRAAVHRREAQRWLDDSKKPTPWMTQEQGEAYSRQSAAHADAVERSFPLAFFGQFDLASLSRHEGFDPMLPKEGRLLVFYDFWEMPEEFTPEAAVGWRVIWDTAPADALTRAPIPEALGAISDESWTSVFKPAVLAATPIVTPIPLNDKGWDAFDLADGDAYEAYQDWFSEFGTPDENGGENHQLGGYPRTLQNGLQARSQLAANGVHCGRVEDWKTPEAQALLPGAKSWRLLLQIGVDANAGMTGPGAYYVIIRDEDLAARRFERARVTYQCD